MNCYQPLTADPTWPSYSLLLHLLTFSTYYNTHTHTQPFNGLWSGTTQVGWYQKKHPLTPILITGTPFIIFLHLQRSMASSLFILRAWQSSRTTSLKVLFRLPLGLGPSTSYSIHFFTQTSSSFRTTCPYQRSLFCCNTNAMSSIPSLSLNSLLGSLSFSLMPHIHLPFSSLLAEVPPRFLSLQARCHFHATCCFAHNYCTTFLS